MFSNDKHKENAEFPMFMTESGIVMFSNDVQFENKEPLIDGYPRMTEFLNGMCSKSGKATNIYKVFNILNKNFRHDAENTDFICKPVKKHTFFQKYTS